MKATGALLALFMLPCLAAPAWIETPSTRAFRQKVIDLALLYDSSGGIDENGFLIRTAVRAGSIGECKTVDVKITLGTELVREETVRACPK